MASFEPEDDVVVYNIRNEPVKGIVKWVGKVNVRGHSAVAVGIETSRKIRHDEFLGSLSVSGPDGRPLFRCSSDKSSLFLPKEMVIHRKDYLKEQKDVELAQEFGMSLEEYRSQIQHMQLFNRDTNQLTRDNFSQKQNFTVGSLVNIQLLNGEPLHGVIKWIGSLPEFPDVVAGIELDEPFPDCTDGTWNGKRYFTSDYGKGLFCPLSSLKLDTRYEHSQLKFENPLAVKVNEIEEEDTLISPDMFYKYIGDGYGIQGHHNSCYLDATVFGLFALSDTFDEMFLKEPIDEVGRRIKHYLWKGIVNPLRKYGVARHESIMQLRNNLEEFGRMKGANTDEKDPEEFLGILFKGVLPMEPFLNIKRPFGVENEYFMQLFFDFNPNADQINVSEINQLFIQMCHEQQISLMKVPSKLILQTPRFGKDFKLCRRTIPSLILDVEQVLDPSLVGNQKCYFCVTKPAYHKCYSCPREVVHVGRPYIHCCIDCHTRIHNGRKGHQVEESTRLAEIKKISKMNLLSVLCIETSHYVCFTQSNNRWLFHDSMADRKYDQYNIPKVTDVTRDLNDWVYSGNTERLANTPSRGLPECVRRFTEDVYMCIYVNSDLDTYGGQALTLEDRNESPDFTPTDFQSRLVDENMHLTKEVERLKVSLARVEDDYKWSHSKLEQLEKERIKPRTKVTGKTIQHHSGFNWKVNMKDVILTNELLGTGRLGDVQVGLYCNQRVACKTFSRIVKSNENIELVQREINLIAQLRHPNIIQLFGVVLDNPEGVPIIVTELMDMSLYSAYRHFLDDPPSDVHISVMRDVAVGLNYLHSLPDPVVHCNISSFNVLMEEKRYGKWKTKICDIGFTSQVLFKPRYKTVHSKVYTAPECNDRMQKNLEADIYSYGILLCEVMNCTFPENEELFYDILKKVEATIPSVHSIIELCISKIPRLRPSMEQVIYKLEHIKF